jgi:ankyrin repeat protein
MLRALVIAHVLVAVSGRKVKSKSKWGDENPNPGWENYYGGKCDEFLRCCAEGNNSCLEKTGIPLCNLEVQETKIDVPWQKGLAAAAANGHVHTVEGLVHSALKWWDKDDLVNENFETVLMHAAAHGQTAVVRWLLSQGADMRKKSATGETAADLAREGGWDDTVAQLNEYARAMTDQLLTISRTNAPLTVADVHVLACGGADFTVVDPDSQMTPVGMAVERGNAEVLDVLLQLGGPGPAEHLHPRTGMNALHAACDQGDFQLVSLMVQAGVDVNAGMLQFDRNCLHLAAMNGRSGLMSLMIRSGVDVNTKDWKGDTAMIHYTRQMFSASDGAGGIISDLLVHGATTGARDEQGFTALYYCIKNAQLQAVQQLVRAGARTDVTVMEPSGKVQSAMAVAAQHGCNEIVAWLASYSEDKDL